MGLPCLGPSWSYGRVVVSPCLGSSLTPLAPNHTFNRPKKSPDVREQGALLPLSDDHCCWLKVNGEPARLLYRLPLLIQITALFTGASHLWRKGSFGTHSAPGSRFVASMMTVVATLKQQRNVWSTSRRRVRRHCSMSLLRPCSLRFKSVPPIKSQHDLVPYLNGYVCRNPRRHSFPVQVATMTYR